MTPFTFSDVPSKWLAPGLGRFGYVGPDFTYSETRHTGYVSSQVTEH